MSREIQIDKEEARSYVHNIRITRSFHDARVTLHVSRNICEIRGLTRSWRMQCTTGSSKEGGGEFSSVGNSRRALRRPQADNRRRA